MELGCAYRHRCATLLPLCVHKFINAYLFIFLSPLSTFLFSCIILMHFYSCSEKRFFMRFLSRLHRFSAMVYRRKRNVLMKKQFRFLSKKENFLRRLNCASFPDDWSNFLFPSCLSGHFLQGYDYPLYHTAFDTYENFVKLVDPTFQGSETLGKKKEE